MTTKRLTILFFVVTLGFCAVLFLPKSADQPYGVVFELNSKIGDWYGKDQEILQKERDTLGKGTGFARKYFTNDWLARAPGYGVLVSMVLSGHDMATSIHRSERCFKAQGWTPLGSDFMNVHVPGKGSFPVKRLYNRRRQKSEDGTERTVDAYTYYWFVGDREITASHFGRWFTDNRDRLLRGVNQRWAFISVTGVIPAQPDEARQADARKFTDETVRGFIAELASTIHGPSLKYN